MKRPKILPLLLKEQLQYLYSFADGSNEYVSNSAKLPDTREFGMYFELTDGRNIHAMVISVTPSIVYGTVTEDGVRVHTFDLNSSPNTYYTTFKKKIEDIYDCPLLNDTHCKKAMDTYLQRLKIK